ncbi:sensor domain-containing diguanylate cyclase [Pseudomonas luteola]|uniref:sensor domain-containing diguanylate cyclase n=2 Tax=Pseudomonas TaxID=286 RepID=UPI003D9FFDC3
MQQLGLAFVCLVIFALTAMECWQVWSGYRQALLEAETSTSNLARSVAQHAEDSIKEIDTLTIGAQERLEWDGLGNIQTERLRALFKRQVAGIPQLHGLFVYDKEGKWLVTDKDVVPEGANNSDREYFIYHQNHTSSEHRIGPVVKSRSTGELILPVSRRISNRDGSFAGVLLATLRVDYFVQFYSGFKVDDKGAIVLALTNGTILARRPFNESVIGSSLSKSEIFTRYLPHSQSGTVLITAVVDGVKRMYSYQQLTRYPLIIEAGLSKEAILASWRADAERSAAVVAFMIAGMLALGVTLLRQIRRTVQTEEQLRQAHRELEELSLHDSLTGLGNRRQLDRVLPIEINRARRSHDPLGVIMIDIDHFKRYNDLYGHLAGDACIQAVAQVIRDATRRVSDLAIRYGGEEMTILLPGTDELGTYQVAERALTAIRSLHIPHQGSEIGEVTVSAGVYTYRPTEEHIAPELLIKAADKALYIAKEHGRNRVYPAISADTV